MGKAKEDRKKRRDRARKHWQTAELNAIKDRHSYDRIARDLDRLESFLDRPTVTVAHPPYRGRVQRLGGPIPWSWEVRDGDHNRIAWGEEFSEKMAFEACYEAVSSFRGTWMFLRPGFSLKEPVPYGEDLYL